MDIKGEKEGVMNWETNFVLISCGVLELACMATFQEICEPVVEHGKSTELYRLAIK